MNKFRKEECLKMVLKLAVVKMGCIASSPLLDLVFDERAERDDLEIRVFSSGSKINSEYHIGLIESCNEYGPDLILLVSPNANLEGPSKARAILAGYDTPLISISDAPSKKAWYIKDKTNGQKVSVRDNEGFIIIPSDSMIGARAEFLDPTEMVLFNSDALRVLSICGVVRAIQFIVGVVIDDIKAGKKPELPNVILDAELAVEYGKFTNPYAKAKAYAALTIAESIATITSKACFKIEEPKRYILLAASGHEMMRAAANLADEARELEKSQDSVHRSPHGSEGRLKGKKKLFEKPE